MGKALTSILLCFIILSCKKNDSKYPYAIKDFPKSLRPYLETIVERGYVAYAPAENYIKKRSTDNELTKLCYSEHPLLRGVALEILLYKEYIDQDSLLILHLDDTATISVEQGEFGIHYIKVADNMLDNACWKTFAERDKIIDEVLTKHNNLKSAYGILARIDPKEKHYQLIKEMAMREKWNYENENALYALSKFKKKEDINLIKEELRKNIHSFKDQSFALMREFQDTAFLNILDEWGRRRFVNDFCEELASTNLSEAFVHSLAAYKNEKVAGIFSRMLNWKPKFYCRGDINDLKNDIYDAIWNNQCEAYSGFMKDVKPNIKEQEKNSLYLDPIKRDTTKRTISWWLYDDKRTEP